MTTINPYDIKINGEQTSFTVVDIPITELVFHNTLAANSVSKKPHHGENVVSQSYLPPKLIIVKNNFPSYTNSTWSFGSTLNWDDLKLWFTSKFGSQYSVTNILITDIIDQKSCLVTYTDNQKKHHCYIIVSGSNELPNMYVATETEHDNNLLVNNVKMMQTYRLAENVFLPIGLPGQDAGWYMTLDSNGNIRPSTVQFQIPNVESIQVTNDYVTSDPVTITINKFRNKLLLDTDIFIHGMDTDEIFTKYNQLPLTIDKVFYCPRKSVYQYRAKGTKEETLIINEIPAAQVVVKTLTLKKTMKPNDVVAFGYNVFEKHNENYEIEYIDKEEIHVWYNHEILKIMLGDLPAQLINGDQLVYHFEQSQSGDEYIFDIKNNGIVTSSMRFSLPTTQEQTILTIAIVFGCTLFRNISDFMSVETHNKSYQEFEIKEELGFINYIYKKPTYPIIIDLNITYFDYRGLMAINDYSTQEVVKFLDDSGFVIDPQRRLAYRTTPPSRVVSLGEIVLTRGKRFIDISADADTVMFIVYDGQLTLTKHNSVETQTYQEGIVNIHVDFFPFNYKNVLFEIRRSRMDSEGYTIVNFVVSNTGGVIGFDTDTVDDIKLIISSENVKPKMEVRTDGKLVLIACKLDDDKNTGFIKLKINDSLVKFVITRSTG